MSSSVPSGPLQPSYVFRGHSAPIHAVHFLRSNSRLITGDAEGWVVLWNMVTRRPAAVWRPHTAAILGLGAWGDDKIITWVTINIINPSANEIVVTAVIVN